MGAPTFGAPVPVEAVGEWGYFSGPGEVDFRKIAFLAAERGLMANLVHGVGLGTCHM